MSKESPISARCAVLQSLFREPAFGLEIAKRVEEATGGRIRLGTGSLYPLLRSMENDGLLKSFSQREPTGGGRPRIYYKITADGRRAANEDAKAIAGLFELGGAAWAK